MKLSWVTLGLLLLGACASPVRRVEDVVFPDATPPVTCDPGQTVACDGDRGGTPYRCNPDGGAPMSLGACASNYRCLDNLGCRLCRAGLPWCDPDGHPARCGDDGMSSTPTGDCTGGTACFAGGCVDLCAQARMENSYLGCEYWPVATMNSELGSVSGRNQPPPGGDGFPFAVAVANTAQVAANVRVEGGALTDPVARTVAAGAMEIIQLPWVRGTSRVRTAGDMTGLGALPSLERGGAYHLTSNVPVAVYQFNPLTYRDYNRGSTCAASDPSCFSYTNDASLLLPAHSLTGNYRVLAWPSLTLYLTPASAGAPDLAPGFVAIAATQDQTTVTVTLSSHTLASVASGSAPPAVPAGHPNDVQTYMLNAGDVLQLASAGIDSTDAAACNGQHLVNQRSSTGTVTSMASVCTPQPQYDLTGTLVRASAPVAVFAGHDCAFVPFHTMACDHLEEQLFPTETWGTRFVVSMPTPQLSPAEPTVVRVLSNANENMISTDPPIDGTPVQLERGQYIDLVVPRSTVLTANGATLVSQYFVGQNYFAVDRGATGAAGGAATTDPDMVLEVPIEQWRPQYDFLVPSTYRASYLNVAAPVGTGLELNGRVLSRTSGNVVLERVGNYEVWRVGLSAAGGSYHLASQGAVPIGLKVNGVADYTSYAYPGGLDLSHIAPPG